MLADPNISAWSSNASSNERLNYLNCSLADYEKPHIIVLLNQQIDKANHLEAENRDLIKQLEQTNRRHYEL
jgi:hypothetical protein